MKMVVINLVNALADNGNIRRDERDLYIFGLNQSFIFALNLITTVLIGFLFGMPLMSAIFIVVYLPLRSFAGGYHATTVQRCYAFSIMLTSLTLLFARWLTFRNNASIFLLIASAVSIIIFAPVPAANKLLDATETGVFRRTTRKIISFWVIVYATTYQLRIYQGAAVICASLCSITIMLFLGMLCVQKTHSSVSCS